MCILTLYLNQNYDYIFFIKNEKFIKIVYVYTEFYSN